MDPLLTVEEASEILRVKSNTLYTWAYRQQIPSQKVGNALRFRRRDLELWLKAQARPQKLRVIIDFNPDGGDPSICPVADSDAHRTAILDALRVYLGKSERTG